MTTIRIVGIGMGVQHLTAEAVEALGRSSYVVAARKGPDDPLLLVRREICELHDLDLVEVDDPERDRADPADYTGAVRDWHASRAAAWGAEISTRQGDPVFLVWGDPSLYDSTIRVVETVAALLDARIEVVAGIAAPQLLAARHGIVLHHVGQPVHVTTQRRQAEAIASGQRNLVVMLTSGVDLAGLEDWSIWWGANLGAPSERLVSGTVADVADLVAKEREAAKAEAGWVMDLYLLQAPE
jgi:precorrin-6A synthase